MKWQIMFTLIRSRLILVYITPSVLCSNILDFCGNQFFLLFLLTTSDVFVLFSFFLYQKVQGQSLTFKYFLMIKPLENLKPLFHNTFFSFFFFFFNQGIKLVYPHFMNPRLVYRQKIFGHTITGCHKLSKFGQFQLSCGRDV